MIISFAIKDTPKYSRASPSRGLGAKWSLRPMERTGGRPAAGSSAQIDWAKIGSPENGPKSGSFSSRSNPALAVPQFPPSFGELVAIKILQKFFIPSFFLGTSWRRNNLFWSEKIVPYSLPARCPLRCRTLGLIVLPQCAYLLCSLMLRNLPSQEQNEHGAYDRTPLCAFGSLS